MAFVHVKTGDEKVTIELPQVSTEAAGMIYPQLDSVTDFIIIQNHVFSKMAIDHLHIEGHPDEAQEIEKLKGEDGNAKKEENYML